MCLITMQTQISESDYLQAFSSFIGSVKDVDVEAAFKRSPFHLSLFIIDYELYRNRNDDLHGEPVKRPSTNKLSRIQLTLEEYEQINFLEDDDKDTSPWIPITEEDDMHDSPEDDSEDSEDGNDCWNRDYDKYNLW